MTQLVIENDNVTGKNNDSSFSTALKQKLDSKESGKKANKTINNRFFYSINDLNFLLEQDIKAENLSQSKVYNLPLSPVWCSGIANVRGMIVPVVNMHIFLGIEKADPKNKSKLLWLQLENNAPIIFQIDKLPSIIDYNGYTINPASENSADWVTNTLTKGSEEISIVDHNQLFNKLIKS